MSDYNFKKEAENTEERKKLFNMDFMFKGRTTQEIFDYEGRTFVVKKMNPMEGIAVLKTLLTNALPIDLLGMFLSEDSKMKQMLALLPDGMSKKEMSIDDFVMFEKRLLRNTYEVLKSGEVQVVDNAGNIGVLDVEDNMFLIVFLLVKVIEVNYKDFFIETLQRLGMLEEIKSLTQEVMK